MEKALAGDSRRRSPIYQQRHVISDYYKGAWGSELQCEPVKTDRLAPHFLQLLLAFDNLSQSIKNVCNRLELNVATRPSHYCLLIPPFNFFVARN